MITPEQKAFRKGKIGASDAAAALGVDPFRTKARLYHELKGTLEREDIGEKGIVGNLIEPVIIQLYEMRTGNEVDRHCPGTPYHPSNPPVGTYVHPEFPWMLCHLDGLIHKEKKALELKNVGHRMAYKWGEDGDPDGVPLYVASQCVQQAILADVDAVDVAAFFGGNELRVYSLPVNKKAKDSVLGGLVAFWRDHIEKNVQPEVTEKDLDLLKELYWDIRKDRIMTVEGTATALMFDDYRRIKAQLKELSKKADAYKAAIQDVMKDATVLMRSDDYEFTWKKTKDRVAVDWETAFLALESEGNIPQEFSNKVIEECTRTIKGHRQFLDKGMVG